ncbi:MAG: spore coat associated protein CotJA [Acutalibacteraceae bacterium]|nr:spore coat associated protein CotJA [Acutalibacteraceae bacterium]
MQITITNTDRPATQGAEPIKDAVLAMAYVPVQEFSSLYDEDEAFENGTLFMDLNKPFERGAK